MPDYHYERLSAQDSSFLIFESPNCHMHVGGVAIYEAGPLRTARGGIDIDRLRKYIHSRLDLIPRYRQRLAFVPIERRPVWIDDESFNLNYHVRHTSLPRPGDDKQLKRITARILSQQLDRGKPLWENWIIEGMQGDRFAMLTKAHHSMLDGASGVDLATVLMRATPDDTFEEPSAWIPRPPPTGTELFKDDLLSRLRAPLGLARGLRKALRDPGQALTDAAEIGGAIWDLLETGLQGAAETPVNQQIGPHRRLDWFTMSLDEVKRIKNRLGGTVNDVVVATASGGLRRFFERRRIDISQIDYRATVPVNVRSPGERGTMGNRVSAWLLSLPIQESDPRRRLALVQERTSHLKESNQALATDVLNQMLDWTGSSLLLSIGVKLTGQINPYNLILTNVRGPSFPLYVLGSKMLEAYPQVPLFENQGLGIALFSYLDKLCWGFNADWDLVPDLHELVAGTQEEFEKLREAADRATVQISEKPRVRRRSASKRRRPTAANRGNGSAASLNPEP